MNTGKQVNAMIGLLFLLLLMLGAYFVNESTRQEEAREEIVERNAERGARLFALNCRTCHGLTGLGPEEGGFGVKLNSPAYLILGEGNQFEVEPTGKGEADGIRKFLTDTISCGRTGTFMPPWALSAGGALSDMQIANVVTMITNARWDLVEEIGEEVDEESGLTAEEIVITDPSALSVTQSNCGQFRGAAAQTFRDRDPFAAPGEAAKPAATPAATATTAPSPSGGPAVEVSIGEFFVTPAVDSADANGVTFRVTNDGLVFHDFVIVRSDEDPGALSIAGGLADEAQLDIVGRIGPWDGGGEVREQTFNLTPGNYLLICNLPGHYQLGMAAAFTAR